MAEVKEDKDEKSYLVTKLVMNRGRSKIFVVLSLFKSHSSGGRVLVPPNSWAPMSGAGPEGRELSK